MTVVGGHVALCGLRSRDNRLANGGRTKPRDERNVGMEEWSGARLSPRFLWPQSSFKNRNQMSTAPLKTLAGLPWNFVLGFLETPQELPCWPPAPGPGAVLPCSDCSRRLTGWGTQDSQGRLTPC